MASVMYIYQILDMGGGLWFAHPTMILPTLDNLVCIVTWVLHMGILGNYKSSTVYEIV